MRTCENSITAKTNLKMSKAHVGRKGWFAPWGSKAAYEASQLGKHVIDARIDKETSHRDPDSYGNSVQHREAVVEPWGQGARDSSRGGGHGGWGANWIPTMYDPQPSIPGGKLDPYHVWSTAIDSSKQTGSLPCMIHNHRFQGANWIPTICDPQPSISGVTD